MVLLTYAIIDDLTMVIERLYTSFTYWAMPHGRREEAAAREAEVVDIATFGNRSG